MNKSKELLGLIGEGFGDETNMLQAYANMVGPKGKYPNKEVAAYVKKTHKVSPDYTKKTEYDNIKDLMDWLEDANFHSDYAILNALMRDMDPMLSMDIAKMQDKLGYRPEWLGLLNLLAGGSNVPESYIKTIEQASKGLAGKYDNDRYDLKNEDEHSGYPQKFWDLAKRLPPAWYKVLVDAKKNTEKAPRFTILFTYSHPDKNVRLKFSMAMTDYARKLHADMGVVVESEFGHVK